MCVCCVCVLGGLWESGLGLGVFLCGWELGCGIDVKVVRVGCGTGDVVDVNLGIVKAWELGCGLMELERMGCEV